MTLQVVEDARPQLLVHRATSHSAFCRETVKPTGIPSPPTVPGINPDQCTIHREMNGGELANPNIKAPMDRLRKVWDSNPQPGLTGYFLAGSCYNHSANLPGDTLLIGSACPLLPDAPN